MPVLVHVLTSLEILLVLLVGPAVAASEKPSVRSSVPPTVEVPREPPRPVRVVEPDRAASSSRAGEKPRVEKVNINTADVKTLMTLPGVTRKVARQIVAYRESHGPFRTPADLRNVDGVGNGVWEKNRARIVTK